MWRRLNREDFAGANPLVVEGRGRTFEFINEINEMMAPGSK
jgi:hypothetical protein